MIEFQNSCYTGDSWGPKIKAWLSFQSQSSTLGSQHLSVNNGLFFPFKRKQKLS